MLGITYVVNSKAAVLDRALGSWIGDALLRYNFPPQLEKR